MINKFEVCTEASLVEIAELLMKIQDDNNLSLKEFCKRVEIRHDVMKKIYSGQYKLTIKKLAEILAKFNLVLKVDTDDTYV